MRGLLLLLLLVSVSASAQTQGSASLTPSVLVLSAEDAQSLGLGDLLEQGAESVLVLPEGYVEMQGHHAASAWRGAKYGALVGLGVGAILVGGFALYDATHSCEGFNVFCWNWRTGAVLAIPTTLTGAGIGAVIGYANASTTPHPTSD